MGKLQRSRFDIYVQEFIYYLTPSISAILVHTWKHNRKLINTYFNNKLLMSLIPLFNRGANTSVKRLSKLSNGGEHKLFDLIKRGTLEIAIGKY